MAGNLAVTRLVQRSLDQRRQEVERVDAQVPKYTIVEGTADIDGVGEGLVEVVFPIMFMEKPVWSGDFELGENQSITAYPVYTKFLVQWETITKPGTRLYYTGAHIGVKISSIESSLKSILHFRFSGTGFREPTGATTSSVGGVI